MSKIEKTAAMLAYFWEEKGDIERWVGFDRSYLAQEFPAVLKAWDDYKVSKLVLSAVIRDAGNERDADTPAHGVAPQPQTQPQEGETR